MLRKIPYSWTLFLLLACSVPLMPGCTIGAAPVTTSGLSEIPLSGPEVWEVDGVSYAIAGTRLVPMPEGEIFAVLWSCGACMDELGKLSAGPEADARARELAWPVARKAWQDGRLDTVAQQVSTFGRPLAVQPMIGVAILKTQGGIVSRTSGYRVQWAVAEIQARLASP